VLQRPLYVSLTLEGTAKHNRRGLVHARLESDPVEEVDDTDPTGETL